MNRRTFLTVAATAPIASALPLDLTKIPARKFAKVEIVFKSPGDDPKPNGLQAPRTACGSSTKASATKPAW